jgi:uncharacterized protein (TIGR02646 family)
MRYIKKLNAPQFFTNDTAELAIWDDYHSNKKRRLKDHILEKEQNYLCIYCESKITDNTHIHLEHIKPKYLDVKNLTFDYSNIVVSCNGTRHDSDDTKRYHCGHRKDQADTTFDEAKFLNPVKVLKIREYFKYDYEFKIYPSDKDIDRASYMIDTLHLNDGGLPKARKKALEIFIKKMNEFPDIKTKKEKMNKILNNESIAFISFLRCRCKYKHIDKLT